MQIRYLTSSSPVSLGNVHSVLQIWAVAPCYELIAWSQSHPVLGCLMQTCPHHRRILHVPWVVILVWLMMLLPSVSTLCFHWSMESLTGRASRGRSGYFRLGLVFELAIRHSLGHAVAVSCSLSGLAVATDKCSTTEVAPGCPSKGRWMTFASIPPEFANICESRPCFYPRSLSL